VRVYKLPPKFYDDHVSRDLDGGTVLHRSERRVTVELDAEQFADLLDDAQFYVEMGTREFGTDYAPLIKSAAATARALIKQGAPC
jgi:hypothetical protein